MKNNTLKQSRLTFVLYSINKLPKVYNLNKNIFKFYLIIPVIIISLSIFILLFVFNYNKLMKNFQLSSIEKKNVSLIEDVLKLNTKISKLEKENEVIYNRLKLGIMSDNQITFFKSVLGQKISLDKNILIDDIKINSSTNSSKIIFNVKNLTSNSKKIAGYLYLIINNEKLYQVFPTTDKDVYKTYSKGEYFSASRIRPFKYISKFIKTPTSLKIIIFNKYGDIIYKLSKNLITDKKDL